MLRWNSNLVDKLTDTEVKAILQSMSTLTYTLSFAGVDCFGCSIRDLHAALSVKYGPDLPLPQCLSYTEWDEPCRSELGLLYGDACSYGDQSEFYIDTIRAKVPSLRQHPQVA